MTRGFLNILLIEFSLRILVIYTFQFTLHLRMASMRFMLLI